MSQKVRQELLPRLRRFSMSPRAQSDPARRALITQRIGGNPTSVDRVANDAFLSMRMFIHALEKVVAKELAIRTYC